MVDEAPSQTASWLGSWRRFAPQVKQFSRILSANTINNAVAFVVMILAARRLGPGEFGALGLAVTISILGSRVLNMGQNLAVVQVHDRDSDPTHQALVIRGALLTQLVVLVLIAVVLVPVSTLLVEALPALQGHQTLVQTALITSGLLSMWMTLRGVDQARRDFRMFERQIAAYAGLRLVLSVLVFTLWPLKPFTIFAGMYAVPVATLILLSWLVQYGRMVLSVPNEPQKQQAMVWRAVLRYGVWVGLSGLLYTLFFRIPQLTLARHGDAIETGIFSAALTFMAVFSLLNDSIRILLLPYITTLSSPEDRMTFRRRFRRVAPLGFIGLLAVLGSMATLQYWVLGPGYHESVPTFLVIGTAIVVGLYFGFQNMLVHSHGIPHLDAMVNLGRVIVLLSILPWTPAASLPMAAALAGTLLGGELLLFYLLHRHELRATA